jgi:hypothetical protein
MKASAILAVRALLFFAGTFAAVAHGQSVTELIDQHMKPVSGLVPTVCSDAEFLRRVSLDLTGIPPTADEARDFIADTTADKRARLVDQCLKSPRFVRHLASTLDVMLMERRADANVTADEWQAWLLQSVRSNKPWNVLAREILSADGDDAAERPAVKFALDRGSEPNLLAHDISRIFFGRDMQCAQCHDHPLVYDYLQSDYHGLLAYVVPSYVFVRKDGDTQTTLQAERAGSDLVFESVFFKGTPHRTGPRLPDGVALDEPFFLPGDEYLVAPTANAKSVPKFSRRTKLAELATNGSNQAFNQNIANRLWAHMFGRGLVHPLDLHHPDNPAADPELLRLLGERFATMNYDIQGFLREIALSGAYQRSFDLPPDLMAAATQAAETVAQMEQQRDSLVAAAKESSAAYSQAKNAWQEAEATMLPAAEALDGVRNSYAEAKKKVDEVSKVLADATAQQQTKLTVATAVKESAAAAQLAVEASPEDQQLSETVQQLVAKSQQLQTELAAMTKAVEEQSAALKPLQDALSAAQLPVDAALANETPLKSAMLVAERAMLSARRKAAADTQTLAAYDQRLGTARKLARVHELKDAVAMATKEFRLRETELAGIQDQQQACTAETLADAAESELAARQAELDTCVAELAERLANDFTIATLKPLTPEQLCWSVLRVTGIYDRQWQAEAAELDIANPLTDEQKQNPSQLAARAIEIEQKTFEKLKSNLGTFVAFYGAAAGQPQNDFFSTADQALFAANGGAINSWVAPSGGNVTDRMVRQTDSRLAAKELYLTVLSRLPTEEETAEVSGYLAARAADKNVAAQELVWSLLNSAEFRFNH